MTLYAHSPKNGDSGTRVLAFCLLFGGLIIIMLSSLVKAYAGAVQMLGFLLAIASVMVCTRFMLTYYTYSVESPDGDGIADLVIIERRGGRERTVCRVAVSGGRLTVATRANKPLGRCFDYRPGLFTPSYYFTPTDSDGDSIRFSPDDRLLSALCALGAKKDGENAG